MPAVSQTHLYALTAFAEMHTLGLVHKNAVEFKKILKEEL